MGNLLTAYNPFDPVGVYNIKTYIYENKRQVITILTVIILIIIGFIIIVWSSKSPIKMKDHFDIPAPKFGDGPFGKGIYIPPKDILVNSILSS
jgi:hypothetical protein